MVVGFLSSGLESLDAKKLWKEFQPFGHIVDAFIANKHSKTGKRFGFIRFLGVNNGEEFAKSMSNIWIGSYHVFVSIAKFQRTSNTGTNPVPTINHSCAPPINGINNSLLFSGRQSFASVANEDVDSKKRFDNGTQREGISIQLCDSDLIKVEDTSTVILAKANESLKTLWSSLRNVSPSFTVIERLIWIDVIGLPLCAWGSNAIKKVTSLFGKFMFFDSNNEEIMSMGRVCIATKRLYSISELVSVGIHGKKFDVLVKEIGTWNPKIMNDLDYNDFEKNDEEEESRTSKEEEDQIDLLDDFIEHVAKENVQSNSIKEDFQEEKNGTCFESDASDCQPPGVKNGSKSSSSYKCSTSFRSHKFKDKKGFLFIDEMNRMIEVGDALGYDVKGCKRSLRKMINGIETKMTKLELFQLKSMRGNFNFDYACSMDRGRSGGLITMWDPNVFTKNRIWCNDNYVIVEGKWKNSVDDYFLINVYGQQQPEKSNLWEFLCLFIQNHQGNIILFGDFNEVRCKSSRFGSIFSTNDAAIFNNFIQEKNNFGLIPFKVFNSWFDRSDFDDVVKVAWNNLSAYDEGYSTSLHAKLKGIKSHLKVWISYTKENETNRKKATLVLLRSLDEKIDAGQASDVDRLLRINTWQELDNLEKLESMDLLQKARVKWDVEGDKNLKFCHGVINSKRKSQAIQGILYEGIWITDPSDIKLAFLNFYKEKFSCQDSSVIFPSMSNVKRLTNLDRANLDSLVTLDEIKSAVWDCGSQKASGPDGISFKFVKNLWDVMKPDIQNFVFRLFSSGSFPPGLNSSFFTLIPMVSNPLYIKDFRPISLIGFQYKIVAKILANRLSKVIDLIISHEQTTFILGHQILDGPLNLSEVIDWIGSSDIRLSHLFYVDDVIIFSEWNQHDMDNIIHILNIFYLASGLKINISKSNLYGVGVSSEEIEVMAVETGCSASNIPFSYLGLPIGSNMSKISNWNILIERFKSRLSEWKANMLSSGGRLTLIKLVLGSLGIYYFFIFKAPEAVLKVLESLLLKSIHGSEAGIDLKGCKTNGLWAYIVGTLVHFHSSGFVPLNSLRFKKNPNCFIIDRIVNGLWKWDWNRPIFGGRLQADLHKLLVDIGSLNIEINSDCLVSSLSTDGFFSVSLTRKHIDNYMLSSSLPSTRWCKIIHRKVNIFMWRMFLDRLPHRLKLSSRGLDLDSILCPVCNEVVESNSHLFFSCVAASNIWRLIRGWCDLEIPILSSCHDWVSWFSSWTASKIEKDKAYAIFASTSDDVAVMPWSPLPPVANS
uniref:RNA-directed DNA polymerase, eukaryota, reverse transcriptase zinc-binding domain protein n=1 Tax=Tanacetum cinerariifolium TaxID=118510 RepID=A0A6L2N5Z5_TANCI|nr:RNA-directed DNA polymerase, eukaryota, reverse transcriptase zinc-binding domain protein [Tanacetum cinerariifolium]